MFEVSKLRKRKKTLTTTEHRAYEVYVNTEQTLESSSELMLRHTAQNYVFLISIFNLELLLLLLQRHSARLLLTKREKIGEKSLKK